MPQSSRTLRTLPACFLAVSLVAVGTSSIDAQTRYRVTRAAAFRQEAGPQGKELATVSPGIDVSGGEVKEGWVKVELEGFVWARSTSRSSRDGHDLALTRPENLRVGPNGAVIARLLSGFLLDEV